MNEFLLLNYVNRKNIENRRCSWTSEQQFQLPAIFKYYVWHDVVLISLRSPLLLVQLLWFLLLLSERGQFSNEKEKKEEIKKRKVIEMTSFRSRRGRKELKAPRVKNIRHDSEESSHNHSSQSGRGKAGETFLILFVSAHERKRNKSNAGKCFIQLYGP